MCGRGNGLLFVAAILGIEMKNLPGALTVEIRNVIPPHDGAIASVGGIDRLVLNEIVRIPASRRTSGDLQRREQQQDARGSHQMTHVARLSAATETVREEVVAG